MTKFYTATQAMKILGVKSDETVRRRAKALGIKPSKIGAAFAYSHDDVTAMANMPRNKRPKAQIPSEATECLLTAREAAHLVKVPHVVSFLNRARELGISADSDGMFRTEQLIGFNERYEAHIAKRVNVPKSGVAPLRVKPIKRVSVAPLDDGAAYERTTQNGAVYLRRVDAGKVFDWQASL